MYALVVCQTFHGLLMVSSAYMMVLEIHSAQPKSALNAPVHAMTSERDELVAVACCP